MESTQVLTQAVDLEDAETEEIPGIEPQLVKVAKLTIAGVDHDVWNRMNTIGRASDCDIVIENEAVSSRHAIIDANRYGFHRITDLGSTNKTRINRVVIPPKVPKTIDNGATLRIANVDAVYRYIEFSEIVEPIVKISPRKPVADVVQIPGTPEEENVPNADNIPETPDGESEAKIGSEDDIFGSSFSPSDFASSMAELSAELEDAQAKIARQEPSNASLRQEALTSPRSSPDNSIVAASQPLFESDAERLAIQAAETQLTNRFPAEVGESARSPSNLWDDLDAATQLKNEAPAREANRETGLAGVGDVSFSSMLTQVKNEKTDGPAASSNGDGSFSDMSTQPNSPALRDEVGGLVMSSDGEESFSDLPTQPTSPKNNLIQRPPLEIPREIDISDIDTQQIPVHVNNGTESRNIEDRIGAMNERNIYSAATQEVMRSTIKRATTYELLEMLENSEAPSNQRTSIPIAPLDKKLSSMAQPSADSKEDSSSGVRETPGTSSIPNGIAAVGAPKNVIEESFSEMLTQARSPATNREIRSPDVAVVKCEIIDLETQEIAPIVHQPGPDKIGDVFEGSQFVTPKARSRSAEPPGLSKSQGKNLTPKSCLSSREKSAQLPPTPSSDFELNIDDSISDMMTQVNSSNNAQPQASKIEDIKDIIDMETQEIVPLKDYLVCENIEGKFGSTGVNNVNIYSADTVEITPAASIVKHKRILEDGISAGDTDSPTVEESQFPVIRETKQIVYSDDDSPPIFLAPKSTNLDREKSTGSKKTTPSSNDGSSDSRDIHPDETTNAELLFGNLEEHSSREDASTVTLPKDEKIAAPKDTQLLEGSQFPVVRETKPIVYSDEESHSLPCQSEIPGGSPLPHKPASPGFDGQAETSALPDAAPALTSVSCVEQTRSRIESMDTVAITDMETQNIAVEDTRLQGHEDCRGQTEGLNDGSVDNEGAVLPAEKEATVAGDVLVKGKPDAHAASRSVVHQADQGGGGKLLSQRSVETIENSQPEFSQFPVQRVAKTIVYSDEDTQPTEPVKVSKKRFAPKKRPRPISPADLEDKPADSSTDINSGEDLLKLEGKSSEKISGRNQLSTPLGNPEIKLSQSKPSRTSGIELSHSHGDSLETADTGKQESGSLARECPSSEKESENPSIPGNSRVENETVPPTTVSVGEVSSPRRRGRPHKQAAMNAEEVNRACAQPEGITPLSSGPLKQPSKSCLPDERQSVETESTRISLGNAEAEPTNLEPSTTSLEELQAVPHERRERPRKQAFMSCDAEQVKMATSSIGLPSGSPPIAGRFKQRRKAQTPKKLPGAEKNSSVSSSPAGAGLGSNDTSAPTSSLVELEALGRRERPRKQAFMSCDAENVKKAALFDRDGGKSEPITQRSPPVNVKKFKRSSPTKYSSIDLTNDSQELSVLNRESASPKRQRRTVPNEKTTPVTNPPSGSSSVAKPAQPKWTSPLSRRGKKISVKPNQGETNVGSSPTQPTAEPTPPVSRRRPQVTEDAASNKLTTSEPPVPQRVSARGKKAKAALSTSGSSGAANNAAKVSDDATPAVSSVKRFVRKRGSQVLPDTASQDISTSAAEKSSPNSPDIRRSSRQTKKKTSFDELASQKEEEIKQKKISAKSQSSTPSTKSKLEAASNVPAPAVASSSRSRRGQAAEAATSANVPSKAPVEPPQKRVRNSKSSLSSQDVSVASDSQSQTLPDGRRSQRQRRKKLSYDEIDSQKEEEIKQRKNAIKSRRAPVASASALDSSVEDNARGRQPQSNTSTRSRPNSLCEPPTKKARNSQATPSTSAAQNSLLADGPPRVMFTSHIDDSKFRTVVKKFGGRVVSQPKDCTVLITDKIRRTANFLSVLALGKPIVSPNWLSKSKAFNGFTDPNESILTDPENERTYDFSLVESLGKSRNRRLLEGYTIYVTPSVLPPPKEMQQIIECSGGRFGKKLPATWPANSVVISNPHDSSSWRLFAKKGVCPPILSAEAILSGVLRQEFELSENRLR